MSKSVAVLMGGWSAEREVSLASGKQCAKSLREAGYTVTTIDAKGDIGDLFEALDPRPDVVFNALHGRWGEDGRIQGLLDFMAIPYTHSGLLASALAMDKPTAKRVFEIAGLPCAESRVVHRDEVLAGDVMARPYVVKPVGEGSSVGVHIVLEGENEPPLGSVPWPFGDTVMVERYIPGREITVAVMGERALGVTELRTDDGFYDYQAKYTVGRTVHLCPAPLEPEAFAEAQRLSVEAHNALGCRGVSRADLRYDDTNGASGGFYLLEINTQPGMTPMSLVPEQAAQAGISFPELVGWMVEHATCDA